jgi:aspartyl-tRNA(Asn)/glutamyl-tRNA(Gln) amidotransferase subunit B
LQRAIDYEALRQIELIEDGGTVRQETRHWDEGTGETSTLRVKEDAEDYRYFREPDLVDLAPSQEWQDQVRGELGPMPAERRATLTARLSDPTDAQLDAIAVVIDLSLDAYVNQAIDAKVDPAIALARSANELASSMETLSNLTAASFIATLQMEQSGALSATQSKTVLLELLASGGDPAAIAKAKGFEQLSSDSLGATIDEVIAQSPDEWSRFKEGDDKLSQFFIGQVMKLTKGQANGKAVIAELQKRR